jgi:hypothetical protein
LASAKSVPNNRIQADTKSQCEFVVNSKCLGRLFVHLILGVGHKNN